MPLSYPRSRLRNSFWFFFVLALLSSAAIIIPIVYNLSIQLRPEELADARRLWQENAPDNYDLKWLVEIKHAEDTEPEKNEYLVQVRRGRVVLVMEAAEVLYFDPSLAAVAGPGILALSPADVRHYGMPALFDEIEAALRRDLASRRKNHIHARFDSKDGHPIHYVQSVRGTKEREEWNITMTRLPGVASEFEPPGS